MKKILLIALLSIWFIFTTSAIAQDGNDEAFCVQNWGAYSNGECVWWNPTQICFNKCKNVQGETEEFCTCKCNWWIVLNTNFPFVGRCIAKTSDDTVGKITNVFTDILMTIIITAGFAMLIWAGVQFAMNKPKEGRWIIINVIIAFAALWSLGIILRLINPNFFR